MPIIVVYNYKNKSITSFLNQYKNISYINPCGVMTNIQEIINYINKDECNWNKILSEGSKPIENLDENFGHSFSHIGSMEELNLPVIFGELINSQVIFDSQLQYFMNLIYNYGIADLKCLVKPSLDKNVKAPNSILSIYYLRLYTEESDFYGEMNKSLTNGHYDKYKAFIYLMMDGIGTKIFSQIVGEKLYRGTLISKEELNNIEKELDNKNQNISADENENGMYFS